MSDLKQRGFSTVGPDRLFSIESLKDTKVSYPIKDDILIFNNENQRWENKQVSLDSFADVTITDPLLNNQVLKYDASEQAFTNQYLKITDLGDVCVSSVTNGDILTWTGTCWENTQPKESIKCFSALQTSNFISALLSTPGIGGETGNFNVNIYPRAEPWVITDFVFSTASSMITQNGIWKNLIPSDEPSAMEDISVKEIELIKVNDFDISSITIDPVDITNVDKDCCYEKYQDMYNILLFAFATDSFKIATDNSMEYVEWENGMMGSGTEPLYSIVVTTTDSGFLPIASVYRVRQ